MRECVAFCGNRGSAEPRRRRGTRVRRGVRYSTSSARGECQRRWRTEGRAEWIAAVLDINLDGEKVYPAAEELHARGIPFILASGYGESTLPEKWRDQPRLSKPFLPEQLEQLLRSVASRSHVRT